MYVLVYRLSFLPAIGYSTAGPLFKDTFAFLSTDFLFSILSPIQLAPLFCIALQPLNPLLICLAVWYREIERFFNTYSDMIIGLCPSHSVAWTP